MTVPQNMNDWKRYAHMHGHKQSDKKEKVKFLEQKGMGGRRVQELMSPIYSALDAAGDDIVQTSRTATKVDDDDELGVFEAATGADAGAWLARVVAGAADGPSAFDPFSSRKAHVLKQAKQCLEKCRAGLCENQ